MTASTVATQHNRDAASSAVPAATAFEWALAALDRVPGDPREAQRMATDALAMATASDDSRAASVAERTLGIAAAAAGDTGSAIVHLRRAVHLGLRAGDETLAARARMSLANALAASGDARGGLAEANRAATRLAGVELAALETQRAQILHRLGRLDEALAGYRVALPVFRRAGDRLREARLLNYRGLFHLDVGAVASAERDFRLAHALFAELGQRLSAAGVMRNLGYTAARRGDVPAALRCFDASEEEFAALGIPCAFPSDRCELLLSARLVEEARACAEDSIRQLDQANRGTDLAEAHLMLAEVSLLQGDVTTAGQAAGLALAAFQRQGRTAWAHLAQYALLRVKWQVGNRSDRTRRQAQRVADRLQADGWAIASLDARLTAGRIALEAGATRAAERDLVAVSRARRSGPVQMRVKAWHAEALLRLARGDRRGALAAASAGMAAVDAHRASLGATELRVHASGHGEQLATLGLRLALAAGRPAQVFRWAERWRAGALRLRPVRAPGDAELAAELAELRSVRSQIESAALSGGHTGPHLARQARLERSIMRRCRRADGGTGAAGAVPELTALAAALGDRALLEFVECDGNLSAVVASGGRCRLRPVAGAAEVSHELDSLRFALRRLVGQRGTEASRAAALAGARHSARRLEDLLLRPVLAFLGDRELVVVPTGGLYGLPWSLLPSCRDRPTTVTPSAALWLRAHGRPADDAAGKLLVAGPGVPHAVDEVRCLSALYPDATVLTGDSATAAAVLAGMQRASLVHLASHGTFRSDNPLFSAISLHDGPLNVFDLEGLTSVPRTIVLASCDSGVPQVHPGDDLLGLTSALVALGTTTLVASVVPVPDAATRSLMVSFHEALRSGTDPAKALAAARTGADAQDPRALAAAAAFTCFGSG